MFFHWQIFFISIQAKTILNWFFLVAFYGIFLSCNTFVCTKLWDVLGFWKCALQSKACRTLVTVRRWCEAGAEHHQNLPSYLLGCELLVSAVADHHVRHLLPEARDDPLEAALLPWAERRPGETRWGSSGAGGPRTDIRTDLGGAVDVLDGEDVSQAVEQNFGQSRDQLSGGDQHVHALPSVTHRTHTAERSAPTRRVWAGDEQNRAGPGLDEQQRLESGAEPRVRHVLDLRLNPQEKFSLHGVQEAWRTRRTAQGPGSVSKSFLSFYRNLIRFKFTALLNLCSVISQGNCERTTRSQAEGRKNYEFRRTRNLKTNPTLKHFLTLILIFWRRHIFLRIFTFLGLHCVLNNWFMIHYLVKIILVDKFRVASGLNELNLTLF